MNMKKGILMLVLAISFAPSFTTMAATTTYATQSTEYVVIKYNSASQLTTDIYYTYNSAGEAIITRVIASCANPYYQISSISYSGSGVVIIVSYVHSGTIQNQISYYV